MKGADICEGVWELKGFEMGDGGMETFPYLQCSKGECNYLHNGN